MFTYSNEYYKCMPLKRTVNVLLYLGLLLGGLVFAKQAFEDYISSGTRYMESMKALTIEDMPTLTFCFVDEITSFPFDEIGSNRLVHGEDFTINVTLFENQTIQLIENVW